MTAHLNFMHRRTESEGGQEVDTRPSTHRQYVVTSQEIEELRLLRELPEVVENLLAEETNSYCEFCRQHAPKGFPDGELTGPVTHLQDCPAKAARDLLAALDRHREGK